MIGFVIRLELIASVFVLTLHQTPCTTTLDDGKTSDISNIAKQNKNASPKGKYSIWQIVVVCIFALVAVKLFEKFAQQK